MIVLMENTIVLTDPERMELNQRMASRSGRADEARRARGHHADSCAGGAHSGMDAQAYAAGRGDSVEHPQTGNAAQDQSYDGVAGVGQARPQSAAARPLHGDQR